MSYSIIIPTFNRADSLARTLRSLAQLDFPAGEFEILVVDNASSDPTREVFEKSKAEWPKLNWRYLYEPILGSLSGRHRGVHESRGDVCVFTDDDVLMDVNWLNAQKEAFADPAVALVGGPSRPIFDAPEPDWLKHFYNENEHGHFCGSLSLFEGGDRLKEIDPVYLWSLNYSIRRKALLEAGGFHPCWIHKALIRFQGDGETGLSLKIRKAGFKSMYHPQMAVQHEIFPSRLTGEYFQYRAFLQGICDSFTRIREHGAMVPKPDAWKDPFRRIKWPLLKILRPNRHKDDVLKDLIYQNYMRGFSFHQKEVKADPRLLQWVLKKDYWDYSMPEGWRDYLKDGNPPR